MSGEKTLISREGLATRWDISVPTVIRYENEGVISRVSGIPSPRYHIAEIEKIEGVEVSPLSPIERRRLEKENEKLKEQVILLNGILSNISSQCGSWTLQKQFR